MHALTYTQALQPAHAQFHFRCEEQLNITQLNCSPHDNQSKNPKKQKQKEHFRIKYLSYVKKWCLSEIKADASVLICWTGQQNH